MRKRHLTDAEVIELLNDPTPARLTRKRQRLLAHFVDCDPCGDRFDRFAGLISLMTRRETSDRL